ncbi:hypothetical protein [Amylibacter sp. IMCC11727]|uniref:hypothetical protein n=1 Tax=Amylibacter sp. IMCC11727 TaxID=3039851 RepID=UPI00244DDE90|nr:hypothetical protein [Amylibacter sp. IMCC11727]WGI20649.1 hypothetical protein QBD29_11045 [Amylibacter sp. IMCC11727]
MRIFKIVCVGLMCAFFSGAIAQASETRWTVKKTIKKGETVKIQNMILYSKSTCEWHKKPPVPKVFGKVKLGELSYRTGVSSPDACPNEKINANIADYRAGQVAGKDRFSIHWKATEGNHTFKVRYVITVK